MRAVVDGAKFVQALKRLETLFWDCRRNGGPDVEIESIRQLLSEAALDHMEEDDEIVIA
jgi:hypothetical protein